MTLSEHFYWMCFSGLLCVSVWQNKWDQWEQASVAWSKLLLGLNGGLGLFSEVKLEWQSQEYKVPFVPPAIHILNVSAGGILLRPADCS